MSRLEDVSPPKIGGTLPHDAYIVALHSIAVSLKRIADSLETRDNADRPIGLAAVAYTLYNAVRK